MPRSQLDNSPAVEIEISRENPSSMEPQAELTVAEQQQPAEEVCPEVALSTRIEALLISSDRPLTESRIAALIGVPGKGASKAVVKAIDELNGVYEQAQRSFRIERLAGGWQILTQAQFGPVLNRLHTDRQQSKLSQPALETLAIIAYRQPIMRAEVEAIRGVASGEVLRGLLERRLVKIVGRAEELGRPMLYGTTKEFLKVFGLASLDDMPVVQGLGESKKPRKVVSEADSADDGAASAEKPGVIGDQSE
jgi:segregation and condensation protein B